MNIRSSGLERETDPPREERFSGDHAAARQFVSGTGVVAVLTSIHETYSMSVGCREGYRDDGKWRTKDATEPGVCSLHLYSSFLWMTRDVLKSSISGLRVEALSLRSLIDLEGIFVVFGRESAST